MSSLHIRYFKEVIGLLNLCMTACQILQKYRLVNLHLHYFHGDCFKEFPVLQLWLIGKNYVSLVMATLKNLKEFPFLWWWLLESISISSVMVTSNNSRLFPSGYCKEITILLRWLHPKKSFRQWWLYQKNCISLVRLIQRTFHSSLIKLW